MKTTAVLEDWVYHPDEKRMSGFIYHDLKQRFEDGTLIKTSKVIERGFGFIVTENSKYVLGEPLNNEETKGD